MTRERSKKNMMGLERISRELRTQLTTLEATKRDVAQMYVSEKFDIDPENIEVGTNECPDGIGLCIYNKCGGLEQDLCIACGVAEPC